ncbi:hypothetical protein TD95_004244 [Thielaviopsis punctulata]|uniref:Precorrin-2 dehydrogenase n=1 Tax=Thielaviopsis punctulata TaxID=72032 RepID=A0A0F4Z8R1_9PEZI|nr:hypothetical protein TD95_004244 [Thielaviopsis punctulata]
MLLAAFSCSQNIHLVLGPSAALAASRCSQALAAGAQVILIGPGPVTPALQALLDGNGVRWIEDGFREEMLTTLGRPEVDGVVDAVFVVDTKTINAPSVSAACKKLRIPINVIDSPSLCSFSLLSVHSDGPLHIGVTTSGHGCKLASRIRREIASSLPPGLGAACARLGRVRRQILSEEELPQLSETEEESTGQSASFNKLVKEGSVDAARGRRLRWLAQVCEYWPLKRLVTLDDAGIDTVLSAPSDPSTPNSPNSANSPAARRNKIILAGSGPGHPDLLTRATFRAIQTADVILADKLVPAGVLALIPRRTPVTIARKFPGNADAAQAELHTLALEAWQQGKTVLRLKQGDPYIYGRGGEEVMFFRDNGAGDSVVVLPGMTSALSAPLFAGIPATQRDVSDQVLICTGTGKKGAAPVPPDFVPTRTVVFLMALHRISGLVSELTQRQAGEDERRRLFPRDTPCAVLERATCPDQRVIRTTLENVVQAIEAEGSRPPGLLVVGAACRALQRGVQEKQWVVEEGFNGMDMGVVKDIEAMAL